MTESIENETPDGAAELCAPDGEAEALRTRLDAVWEAAQAVADGPDDAAASRFLDALLAEGLICPLAPPPGPSEDQPAADEEAIEPLILIRDGEPTLCVFDAVERLADSDVPAEEFVAAPGRALFAAAAEAGARVALNPGVAETDTVFSAETVAMIAALSQAAEDEELIGAAETIEILSPAPPGEALLAALAARLAAAAEGMEGRLSGAWLVEVARSPAPAQGDDGALSEDVDPSSSVDAKPAAGSSTEAAEPPLRSLTLALAVAEDAEAESEAFGALARDLSRLGGVLAPDRGLDVAILQEGERALAAARKVGLGLMAPSEAA